MPHIFCFQLLKFDDLLLFSVSYCCKLNIMFLVVSCWSDQTSNLKPFSILWHFRLTSNGNNKHDKSIHNEKLVSTLVCKSCLSYFYPVVLCTIKLTKFSSNHGFLKA